MFVRVDMRQGCAIVAGLILALFTAGQTAQGQHENGVNLPSSREITLAIIGGTAYPSPTEEPIDDGLLS